MHIIQAKEAKTWLQKTLGHIGKTDIQPLLLKTRLGIHTFGVLSPIDIIILDRNNKVVKLTESLKQNSIFFWNPLFNTVVETKAGFIKMHKISPGDIIQLKILN